MTAAATSACADDEMSREIDVHFGVGLRIISEATQVGTGITTQGAKSGGLTIPV